MAEINSIANGTYTIGETNKLTFSAGPGIKIDEPSAGTVRIGNDETVLWDAGTTTGSYMKDGITFSENRSNFQNIDIYYKVFPTAPVGCVRWAQIDTNTSTSFALDLTAPSQIGVSGFALTWNVFGTCTNNFIQSTNARFWGKQGFSTADAGTWTQGHNSSVPIVLKVIGINRKEV